MIKRVLAFSVHQRWLLVLLTFAASALGVWSLQPAADRRCPGHHQ